jgi:two-component system phosphate regulon sensor histidine kinase PhoR
MALPPLLRARALGTVLVPGAVAVLLVAEAIFLPVDLARGPLRLLTGLSGVALGIAAFDLVRRTAALQSRAAQLAEEVRRIVPAELPRTRASTPEDPLAELSGIVNDLADGLRTRQMGAETERALDQAMVRESPNGLVIIDGRGRVRRHNPAFARLLPLQGDPIGKAPIETVPVVELQEVIDETARTRSPSERNASVGRREVLLRGLPLADGEGCLGVVLDITTVRQAERARRDFVANVSHELRTPVTAVVGYAESLLEDRAELPPWSLPMIEAIDRNARRLGALIEDVLHLSKIEARQADLRLEREPLRPVVSQAIARFEHAARAREIVVALADGPEVEARINAEGLEHALGNLVDNAIKYSPPGGRVDVSISSTVDAVRVTVADSGIGIDPVHHERVFERFYRVDPGRSRDVGGTGLGLALVKHLCLAMEAEVSLESKPGEGSRFTLRLPR